VQKALLLTVTGLLLLQLLLLVALQQTALHTL
jgi:hypothetical protein